MGIGGEGKPVLKNNSDPLRAPHYLKEGVAKGLMPFRKKRKEGPKRGGCLICRDEEHEIVFTRITRNEIHIKGQLGSLEKKREI